MYNSCMEDLCIVPCGKKKIWDKNPGRGPAPASEAYIGGFASAARAYAERFYPSRWIVLSAKYGFLWPGDLVLAPYNISFSRRGDPVVTDTELRSQAQILGLDQFSEIVVVAGKAYTQAVRRAFGHTNTVSISCPLEGLHSMGSMVAKMRGAIMLGFPI